VRQHLHQVRDLAAGTQALRTLDQLDGDTGKLFAQDAGSSSEWTPKTSSNGAAYTWRQWLARPAYILGSTPFSGFSSVTGGAKAAALRLRSRVRTKSRAPHNASIM
jgi:hypothetical protein